MRLDTGIWWMTREIKAGHLGYTETDTVMWRKKREINRWIDSIASWHFSSFWSVSSRLKRLSVPQKRLSQQGDVGIICFLLTLFLSSNSKQKAYVVANLHKANMWGQWCITKYILVAAKAKKLSPPAPRGASRCGTSAGQTAATAGLDVRNDGGGCFDTQRRILAAHIVLFTTMRLYERISRWEKKEGKKKQTVHLLHIKWMFTLL